jgi:hypothetical protein
MTVQASGRPQPAGFLPDQPNPAGAEPRSTHPPTAPERPGLTAASTGTPSKPEEPRPESDRDWVDAYVADFVAMMTELLDREEALKPRITTKINNAVYTEDLTTSNPDQPLSALPPANLRQGGTVPSDPEEVAGWPTSAGHDRRAATPTGPVRPLLQHRPSAPGAGPPHPGTGLCGPAEGSADRADHPPALPGQARPDRLRRQRHRAPQQPAAPHRPGRPTCRHPGHLADRQPAHPDHPAPQRPAHPGVDLGPDPGLPAARTATRATQEDPGNHTRPGTPIGAPSRHRSRSQDWPQATRRAPALTPARTAPPSGPGCPPPPENATMSQDICQRCPETSHNGVRTNRTLASAGPHAGHKLRIARVITGRSQPSPLAPAGAPGRHEDYFQAGHASSRSDPPFT